MWGNVCTVEGKTIGRSSRFTEIVVERAHTMSAATF